MNRQFTVLATTLVLGGALSTGALAATPPTLATYITVGTAPAAVFKGGATVNGGAGFVTTVPITDAAGIVATIAPATADVGKSGSLYIVINTGTTWYMRAATGWSVWNGGTIAPYSTRTLATEEAITIADLEASTGQDFSGKTLDVHVGYQVGTGAVVYSSPIQVALESSQPANCPNDGTVGIAPATPGGKRLCVLSGSYINKNIRLTSNFEYILGGGVFIGGDNTNSSTLTIDSGVKIYGEKGLDFLVINRGSKIHVNGTPTNPVIITSANDATATATTSGRFGGLIINGNAPINACSAGTTTVCEAEGEGSTGKYGGSNAADNSGNLNYLQVKYAGFLITPVNELNGIAFQGVGNGTNVDYVQVYNSSDDGVEFFGGTVNAKHLVLQGNEDDSLDWTFGFSGKIQHVVIQHRNISDKIIEADNSNLNNDASPRAKPLISNLTAIGDPNAGGGILLREGTGAKLQNIIVSRADKFCFSIDMNSTFNNAGTSATALTGNLTVTNSVANCAVSFKDDAADLFKVSDWFNGQTGNSTASVGMTTYINSAAANAITPAAPFDSFFDTTTYVGAVKDAASDWTTGWTFKP